MYVQLLTISLSLTFPIRMQCFSEGASDSKEASLIEQEMLIAEKNTP